MREKSFAFFVGALLLLGTNAIYLVTSDSKHDASAVEFSSGEPLQSRTDPNIVAQWHFDEGSGNQVGDSSGSGNDGTLNLGTEGNTDEGNAWVNGINGKALEFDGVDDYVDLGMTELQLTT